MANNISNEIFQQNKAILCTESDFFNSPSKPATTVKHAAFSITPKILPSFFLTLAAQRLWEGCSATGNSCWVFVPQTTRVPQCQRLGIGCNQFVFHSFINAIRLFYFAVACFLFSVRSYVNAVRPYVNAEGIFYLYGRSYVNAGALYVNVGSYFIFYHRSYVNDGGLYVNAGASYVNAGRYLLTAGGYYNFYGRHFLLYGGYLLNWGHYSINAGQCFTNQGAYSINRGLYFKIIQVNCKTAVFNYKLTVHCFLFHVSATLSKSAKKQCTVTALPIIKKL